MPSLGDNWPKKAYALIRRMAEEMESSGGRLYLVGGCVREALRGHITEDFDVEVFGIQEARLEPILRKIAPIEYVGRAFGVFKIKGHQIDVSIPRSEVKQGEGHRGFAIQTDPNLSLKQASARRDFTVNAIYFDPLTDEITDPWGGVRDLREAVLRHTSEQFCEDPLRVLRAMQFVARLNGDVTLKTTALCQSMSPEGLSPERFFGEWEKLLLLGDPISKGLRFLRDCGWVQYFPELEALIGCPQDPTWHPEGDVWEHTLHCMDAFVSQRTGNREEDLIVGFAVLCHDFGKPATTSIENGRIHAYGHEKAGLEPAERFLQRLRVPRKMIEAILPLIATHMRPEQLFSRNSSDSAIRRLARDAGRIDLLMRVFLADAAGRPPQPPEGSDTVKWLLDRARAMDVENRKPQPLLRGRDLIELGESPGPHFGTILDEAFELQMAGTLQSREQAIQWLRERLKQQDQG